MYGTQQCCGGINLIDGWTTAPFTLPGLLTFLLFLGFFAALGWRHGAMREFIVFITAVGGWLVLQSKGGIFVTLVNLGSMFTAFVEGGGLTGNTDEAFEAAFDAPDWVTASSRDGFLFLLWVLLVLFIYWLSGRLIKKSNHNGWAILWGIGNGLFVTQIFLPRLMQLFSPGYMVSGPPTEVIETGEVSINAFLRNGAFLIGQTINRFWALIDPVRPVALLILLTLFLLFVNWMIGSPKYRWSGGSGKSK
ncbi:MAG: hypothetical protein KDD92_07390 [Caldilineaceae bacterium]|nr:hypothetical protein [Caldilineaceae bacterium]